MNDLVVLLRSYATTEGIVPSYSVAMRDAAEEIERLRSGINEAINSLAATDQTDNAAYRKLKTLMSSK